VKELIQEMLESVHPFEPEYLTCIFGVAADDCDAAKDTHGAGCLWARFQEIMK
jgi:hypothetical protein